MPKLIAAVYCKKKSKILNKFVMSLFPKKVEYPFKEQYYC